MKAHGYAFRQYTVRNDDAEDQGRVVDIPLSVLEPFEHTEDYDTGYESENGLALFRRAAVLESTELGPTEIVKFYIADLRSAPRIYFQNTRKHPLHYAFARDVLGVPGLPTQFERNTYRGVDRNAMAGSILRRVAVEANSLALGERLSAPISVTFFPSDDLNPEQALLAHRMIEERVGFASLQGGSARVVYEPAGSAQEDDLAKGAPSFAQWGSLWVKLSEIYGSLTTQILNPGLAYGTLRRMTPLQLENEVVSFTDVLLLTRLPAQLPIVGGTITEELQTPLAHVNVAARTRGTPNIALKGASDDARVRELIGKFVRFEVRDGSFALTGASPEEAATYWASLSRARYVPTFDRHATGLLGFESVGFSDAVRIGVKAANLAELSHILTDRAPRGFAVPFYYYDQFMRTALVTSSLCASALEDCAMSGRPRTTCERAHALCLPYGERSASCFDYISGLIGDESFLADSQLREASLYLLRYVLRNSPVSAEFASLLDERVTQEFGANKIRIRSSTNAEDLDNFSGAGLYDSVSANTPEQGAPSSEIRKVWASMWNWRAFEERSFWNIDHLAVQVGCAVTHAFSDEAANGVIITQNIAEPAVAGMYVNVQLGEISVTNPSDGSLPEVFSIVPAPDGVQVLRQRYSSYSPNEPLLSEVEVRGLFSACSTVQNHFAPLYGKHPSSLALDIEFKFNLPERSLVIKQVRPYTVR